MVFEHVTMAQRVLFGAGRAADYLATEVERLGAQRTMVVAAPRARDLATQVTARVDVATWHDEVAMHVPVPVVKRAREVAAKENIDVLVSVGGGSTTGLAKAVALTTGVPIIAVPTTFAGSEATNVWGMTEDNRKETGVDDRVLPVSVIYDAQLTVSLPVEMAIASGLNALAHCVNSMWAPRTDPINQALALEGVRALAAGLSRLRSTADAADRAEMQYGAYMAAVAFASAGSGLHHKICHVLGGAYNLPHAQTHAVVLPHVLAFNGPSSPEAEARLAAAFGAATAIGGLAKLYDAINAPKTLADQGMSADDIPEAARLIEPVVPESNPRPATVADLERLLRAAQEGSRANWQFESAEP